MAADMEDGERAAFGARLKSLRLERGLSHDQLARLCDCHGSDFPGWEKGRRQPGLRKLALMAVALGVSCDYLIRGADCPPPIFEVRREIWRERTVHITHRCPRCDGAHPLGTPIEWQAPA